MEEATRERRVLIGLGAVVAALTLVLLRPVPKPASTAAPRAEVLAAGAFRAEPGAEALALPVTDMLSTALASGTGASVLSTARLLEVSGGATDSAALRRAARESGATLLLDGVVASDGDSVRLVVRRTDLASGATSEVASVSAPDVFAAATRAADAVLRSLGAGPSQDNIAATMSRSIGAWSLYLRGLSSWYAGRREEADARFDSARGLDDLFALVEHYDAVATADTQSLLSISHRARRLGDRPGGRERLLIRWYWADRLADPRALALSEELVTRYAAEPFAWLGLGRALVRHGRPATAIPQFRKALELEQRRERDTPERCARCEARLALVDALIKADSLNAALIELGQWTKDEPRQGVAWAAYADAFYRAGRYDEALAAAQTANESGMMIPLERFRRR